MQSRHHRGGPGLLAKVPTIAPFADVPILLKCLRVSVAGVSVTEGNTELERARVREGSEIVARTSGPA